MDVINALAILGKATITFLLVILWVGFWSVVEKNDEEE